MFEGVVWVRKAGDSEDEPGVPMIVPPEGTVATLLAQATATLEFDDVDPERLQAKMNGILLDPDTVISSLPPDPVLTISVGPPSFTRCLRDSPCKTPPRSYAKKVTKAPISSTSRKAKKIEKPAGRDLVDNICSMYVAGEALYDIEPEVAQEKMPREVQRRKGTANPTAHPPVEVSRSCAKPRSHTTERLAVEGDPLEPAWQSAEIEGDEDDNSSTADKSPPESGSPHGADSSEHTGESADALADQLAALELKPKKAKEDSRLTVSQGWREGRLHEVPKKALSVFLEDHGLPCGGTREQMLKRIEKHSTVLFQAQPFQKLGLDDRKAFAVS